MDCWQGRSWARLRHKGEPTGTVVRRLQVVSLCRTSMCVDEEQAPVVAQRILGGRPPHEARKSAARGTATALAPCANQGGGGTEPRRQPQGNVGRRAALAAALVGLLRRAAYLALVALAAGCHGASPPAAWARRSGALEADDFQRVVETGDYLGFVLATADFDGDGNIEIVVNGNTLSSDPAAPLPDPNVALAVYEWNGSGFGTEPVWTSTDFSALGINHLSSAGAVSVGDFNGDGFDDLAFGIKEEASGDKVAYVSVEWGSAAGLGGAPSWKHLVGSGAPYPLYVWLLPRTDLDGDGFDDLAWVQTNVADVELWVAWGGATETGFDETLASTPIEMQWDRTMDTSPVGDLDGNGGSELVVASDHGTQVWTGQDRELTLLEALPPLAAYQHGYNVVVRRSPDMDGDGIDELWASIFFFMFIEPNLALEDIVYHYPATLSGLSSPPDWSTHSSGVNTKFGEGLAWGDFDGDGVLDLAIGEPDAHPAAPGSGSSDIDPALDEGEKGGGRLWLLKGQPGSLPSKINAPTTVHAVWPEYYGKFARALVAAGDLDGDGDSELLVSSPGETATSPPTPYFGSIFVMYGAPDIFEGPPIKQFGGGGPNPSPPSAADTATAPEDAAGSDGAAVDAGPADATADAVAIGDDSTPDGIGAGSDTAKVPAGDGAGGAGSRALDATTELGADVTSPGGEVAAPGAPAGDATPEGPVAGNGENASGGCAAARGGAPPVACPGLVAFGLALLTFGRRRRRLA